MDTSKRAQYQAKVNNETITEGKTDWNHPMYDSFKQEVKERDDFLLNPFVVQEGIFECFKCGSKRTYSFSKQSRSSDEGTSVFVRCAKCGANWSYR